MPKIKQYITRNSLVNSRYNSPKKPFRKRLSVPSIVLPILGALCLTLSGCNKDKDEAKIVLSKVCPYFPGSVLYSFDRRVLWIQTRVQGISSQTAKIIFEDACKQATMSLGTIKINVLEEMQFDGRSILIIGFRGGGMVAWDVRNGIDTQGMPRYEVVNAKGMDTWLQDHLGYVPKPPQIKVVTLEAAVSTPEGQTIQCQTLDSVQAEVRARELDSLEKQVGQAR